MMLLVPLDVMPWYGIRDIPVRMHVTCGCSGIDMEYINQYNIKS